MEVDELFFSCHHKTAHKHDIFDDCGKYASDKPIMIIDKYDMFSLFKGGVVNQT